MNRASAIGWVYAASAATLVPASAVASAPDSIPELPPIEIRADPLPDLLGPLPLAVHRVTGGDIARRPGGDLRDVLLPLAGVRVTSFGSPFASSSLTLRGSNAEQVLVLVDGRRFPTAQGGGANLASIPLQSVESVDVVRGGASAFWGSDAIGGAVSIRTRRAGAATTRLHTSVGSFGQRSVEADIARPAGANWTWRAATRYFTADGDYAYPDEARDTTREVEGGDVRRVRGDVNVDGRLSSSYDVRVDASGTTSERGEPGGQEFPTPSARSADDALSLGVRTAPRPDVFRPSLDVSWMWMRREYTDPEASFGAIAESHENLRWAGESEIAGARGSFAARAGAGAALDRLRSTTDGDRRRPTGHVRSQVAWEEFAGRRSIRVTAAARVDAVESFAPFVSPRAGVLFDALPRRLRLRASYGASYRAPSFDELFWPARASAAGNPNLRPETGRDADAGIELHSLPGDARVTIDLMHRTVGDLIQWVPGASGVWRPHNVGRARIRGVEAGGSATIPLAGAIDARLDLAGAWLDTRDETGEPNVGGKELVYRPRWTGHAGFALEVRGAGTVETSWRFVDDVYVTRANTKTLEGSILGEVRVRRSLTKTFALDAAVTNVLDEPARDFRDYPLPGRSWALGVTIGGGS